MTEDSGTGETPIPNAEPVERASRRARVHYTATLICELFQQIADEGGRIEIVPPHPELGWGHPWGPLRVDISYSPSEHSVTFSARSPDMGALQSEQPSLANAISDALLQYETDRAIRLCLADGVISAWVHAHHGGPEPDPLPGKPSRRTRVREAVCFVMNGGGHSSDKAVEVVRGLVQGWEP